MSRLTGAAGTAGAAGRGAPNSAEKIPGMPAG